MHQSCVWRVVLYIVLILSHLPFYIYIFFFCVEVVWKVLSLNNEVRVAWRVVHRFGVEVCVCAIVVFT